MEDKEAYILYRLEQIKFQNNAINKMLWGLVLGIFLTLQGILMYPKTVTFQNPSFVMALLLGGFVLVYYSYISDRNKGEAIEQLKSELGEDYSEKIENNSFRERLPLYSRVFAEE